MSWETVEANIDFFDSSIDTWGLPNSQSITPDYEVDIRRILKNLYNTSSTAQALLEQGTSGGSQIRIAKIPAGAVAQGGIVNGFPYLGVNLPDVSDLRYFNAQGKLVAEIAEITIIHELFHAIAGLSDPYAPSVSVTDALLNSDITKDIDGDTVTQQNIVAQEMGYYQNIQKNYYSSTLTSSFQYAYLSEGKSYSENNEVDIVRFPMSPTASGATAIIDTSGRVDGSRDVLIGFNGNDLLASGDGRDYLYGGTGDDTLIGGAGNDVLHGGDFKSTVAADGYDTVDYSRTGLSQAATAGVTIDFDGTVAKFEGLFVISVSADGAGGHDRLVSIENIVVTTFADTFNFISEIPSDIKVQIDAQGGNGNPRDLIDLSANPGAFLVTGQRGNLTIASRSGGGGSVLIKNFDGDIKGGVGADDIVGQGKTVTTSDGSDYIKGMFDSIVAGGGSDKIIVQGRTVIDSGAGDDVIELRLKVPTELPTVKLYEGSGLDIIDGAGSVIIDIGSHNISDLVIDWVPKNVYLYDEDLYASEIVEDHTDGPLMLELPTGDGIIIGSFNILFESIYTGKYITEYETPQFDLERSYRLSPIDIYIKMGDTVTLLDPQLIRDFFDEMADGSTGYGGLGYEYYEEIKDAWADNHFDAPPIEAIDETPLEGGAGDDVFLGNRFSDTVSYRNSAVGLVIDLTTHVRQSTGAGGFDQFVDIAGLIGSAHNDTFIGGDEDNIFEGGLGDDSLNGGDGRDYASYAQASLAVIVDLSVAVSQNTGGAGADVLTSIEGVVGSALDDTLSGNTEKNWIEGGSGGDVIRGAMGDDIIDGGGGYDTLIYASASSEISLQRQADGSVVVLDSSAGGDGTDIVRGIEAIYFEQDAAWRSIDELIGGYGTEGDDPWIGGSAFNDRLYGLAGDDGLVGGAGNDLIDGGKGFDEASYEGMASTFSFARNADGSVMVTDTAGEGIDVLQSIEAVYFASDVAGYLIEDLAGQYGTKGDDASIAGLDGSQNLYGLGGDDVIRGFGGNDLIDGGEGFDEASYEGTLANFSFLRNSDGSITVTDLSGIEGTDRLVNIEAVYFELDQAGYLIEDLVNTNAAMQIAHRNPSSSSTEYTSDEIWVGVAVPMGIEAPFLDSLGFAGG